MTWKIRDVDMKRVNIYKDSLKITDALALVLVNRNVDLDTADDILHHSSQVIKEALPLMNIDQAADMIMRSIFAEDRNIEIFADYDCDGLTAGYIAKTFFVAMYSGDTSRVHTYYPERIEGYGLSMEYCQDLIQQYKHTKKKPLVITVDNGVTKKNEIAILMKNDFPVLVTDHHVPQKEEMPTCLIVDPHMDESQMGWSLCGAGVIWNVCRQIETACDLHDHELTNCLMYAAALGTIGDMVPLDTYNLSLIKTAMYIMNSDDICPINIQTYREEFKPTGITPEDIGWDLVPMLNSCGRMGDVMLGAQFFVEEDKNRLIELLGDMKRRNEERKTLQKEALQTIQLDQDKHEVCVAIVDEYPIGIHGLLASHVVNAINKPTFILKTKGDMLVGSCRSNTIPLPRLMVGEKEKDTICTWGGHAAAGGISLEVDKLNTFIKDMDERVRQLKQESEYEEYMRTPDLILDGKLSLRHVNNEIRKDLSQLAYNRETFKTPIWGFMDLYVDEIKSSRNNKENIHLFLRDKDDNRYDVWAWNWLSKYEELGSPQFIDIAGALKTNFQRPHQTTIDIIDMRPSNMN